MLSFMCCQKVKAGDTRPLSLSNTDGKLFAFAIRDVLEGPVSAWAAKAQRGFIKERVMPANVLDIETRAMEAAADQNRRGALLLFDFGAAFPSINHDFFGWHWLMLESQII